MSEEVVPLDLFTNYQRTKASVTSILENLDMRRLSCDNEYKDWFRLETNTAAVRDLHEVFKANFIRTLKCEAVVSNQFPNTASDKFCYTLWPYYDAIIWFERLNAVLDEELLLFNKLHTLKTTKRWNHQTIDLTIELDEETKKTMDIVERMLSNADVKRLSCIVLTLDVRKLSIEKEYQDNFKTMVWAYESRFDHFKTSYIRERRCGEYQSLQHTSGWRACLTLKPYYDAIIWFERMNTVLEKERVLFNTNNLKQLRASVYGRAL